MTVDEFRRAETTTHVVMSVPHSGTNSLKRYLFEERGIENPFGQHLIQYWHWNTHPKYIKTFFARNDERYAYVPIRNPFDISDSWNRRYFNNAGDKTQAALNDLLHHQIDQLARYGDVIETFKIEDINIVENRGPGRQQSIEEFAKSKRAAELREWMRQPRVDAFYRKYYTDDELWWL